jgi:TRAP-type C4-dicarboxylate transport system permease small subunit
MYERIKGIINAVENFFFYVSCVLFMLMMFLGAFDVLGRYLFNRPIRGTMEISAMTMGAIVFFSWAFTQRDNGHVNVELFVSRYSNRMRAIANCFTLALSLMLFVLIAYQSTGIAIRSYVEDRTLPIIEVSSAPFLAMVPVGAILLCLAIVVQLVDNLKAVKKG